MQSVQAVLHLCLVSHPASRPVSTNIRMCSPSARVPTSHGHGHKGTSCNPGPFERPALQALTGAVSDAASKFDSDEALARALQQEEAGGRTTRASRAARRGGLDDGIATRSR